MAGIKFNEICHLFDTKDFSEFFGFIVWIVFGIGDKFVEILQNDF